MKKVIAVLLSALLCLTIVALPATAADEGSTDLDRALEYSLEEAEEESIEPVYGDRLLSEIYEDANAETDKIASDEEQSAYAKTENEPVEQPESAEPAGDNSIDNSIQEMPAATQNASARRRAPAAAPAAVAYTVNYAANGGTGTMASTTVNAGDTYVLPACGFTRTGYTFDHWETDDGTAYAPGDEASFDADTTVKAVWLWANGSIELDFGWVNPDTYRNDMQYPRGYSLGWINLPFYRNGSADLLDSNGNVVESYTNEAKHTFKNLPAGTYTIRITSMDLGIYNIVESIVNGGPIPHLITEYESDVEVVEGSTNTILRWIVLEYKAYAFKTVTDTGHFSDDTQEKIYYNGGNWAFANTDPTTQGKNPTYNTHDGIYYGDSADLYKGMNKLEVPVLSNEEVEKGYSFVGWQLEGDTSGKIYREDEALAYIVKEDTTFKAAWEYPTHAVTFSTNSDLGEIDGKTSYSYTRDFNNQFVDDIPAVTPKDGYEFVGWFSDLTVNVIPDSEILSTKINKDLNYYAKYRRLSQKYTVKYLPGTDGTLEGRDTLVLTAGSFIPTIPTVNPDENAAFTGKWKVTAVSDGCEDLKVGDVLNEVQISRLKINYDVNFEALYEKQAYTVTYLDGANNTAFMPEKYESVASGSSTPAYSKQPERAGYKFIGWSPAVADKVLGDAVYTAQWEKICDPEKPDEPEKESESKPEKETKEPEEETTSQINPDQKSDNNNSSKPGRSLSPKTGDRSNIAIWAGICALCVFVIAGAIVTAIVSKKKRNEAHEE